MRSVRLTYALESAAFALPDHGRILVLRPRAGDDLSALPKDRVLVVTGFKPDHDHFAAQGFACVPGIVPGIVPPDGGEKSLHHFAAGQLSRMDGLAQGLGVEVGGVHGRRGLALILR